MSANSDKFNLVDVVRQSQPVNTSLPYDTSSLKGKTILITGGASGFGAAFARHWASHGAFIAIGDIDVARGEALVAELRASEVSAERHLFQRCDVTSWEDQAALFRAAARASPSGGIDAAVANAGILEKDNAITGRGFENPSSAHGDDGPAIAPELKCVAVNLTGVLYTTHLALHWLPRARPAAATSVQDRHLLLIGSIAGILPLPGFSEYAVAKHGVTGLFRSLRGTAMIRQGVRVNMICPYFVETPLIGRSGMTFHAGGKVAAIEDVVDAATRLMADEAIVGRALVVGPKMNVLDKEDGSWILVEKEDQGLPSTTRAIWECYMHDYECAELFTRRYLRLLQLVTTIRGWIGWLRDMITIILFRQQRIGI